MSVFHIVNVAALFVMSMAAAYFFLAAGLGVRELRRQGTPLALQSGLAYTAPFASPTSAGATVAAERVPETEVDPLTRWHVYFLVPCLDEEAVIEPTVRALRDPAGRSTTVVIDDGSDDRTGSTAVRAGGTGTTVLRRNLPNARMGKGAALNAGFAVVDADARDRRLDPDRVIVVVMDADGRLSDGALHEVLPLFEDPDVGGVQLAVRIRNRDDNFLLRFQDHQFWTLSSLTQFGRIGTGSVSLGGNGQFTRLSALRDLGTAPWSSSLTEDLDLAVSLSVLGWRLTSTPRASVDQQGVDRLQPLVRQRTRWYQGHMMAIRRLPEILRSDRTSNSSAIEMSMYLLVPWVFDLPWSILYHLVLLEIFLLGPDVHALGSGPIATAAVGIMVYVLGFWPALVTALLARRRDPSMTWRRALAMGHCFVATNYLSYTCAWRALYRIVRGEHGWAKTSRLVEPVGGVANA